MRRSPFTLTQSRLPRLNLAHVMRFRRPFSAVSEDFFPEEIGQQTHFEAPIFNSMASDGPGLTGDYGIAPRPSPGSRGSTPSQVLASAAARRTASPRVALPAFGNRMVARRIDRQVGAPVLKTQAFASSIARAPESRMISSLPVAPLSVAKERPVSRVAAQAASIPRIFQRNISRVAPSSKAAAPLASGPSIAAEAFNRPSVTRLAAPFAPRVVPADVPEISMPLSLPPSALPSRVLPAQSVPNPERTISDLREAAILKREPSTVPTEQRRSPQPELQHLTSQGDATPVPNVPRPEISSPSMAVAATAARETARKVSRAQSSMPVLKKQSIEGIARGSAFRKTLPVSAAIVTGKIPSSAQRSTASPNAPSPASGGMSLSEPAVRPGRSILGATGVEGVAPRASETRPSTEVRPSMGARPATASLPLASAPTDPRIPSEPEIRARDVVREAQADVPRALPPVQRGLEAAQRTSPIDRAAEAVPPMRQDASAPIGFSKARDISTSQNDVPAIEMAHPGAAAEVQSPADAPFAARSAEPVQPTPNKPFEPATVRTAPDIEMAHPVSAANTSPETVSAGIEQSIAPSVKPIGLTSSAPSEPPMVRRAPMTSPPSIGPLAKGKTLQPVTNIQRLMPGVQRSTAGILRSAPGILARSIGSDALPFAPESGYEAPGTSGKSLESLDQGTTFPARSMPHGAEGSSEQGRQYTLAADRGISPGGRPAVPRISTPDSITSRMLLGRSSSPGLAVSRKKSEAAQNSLSDRAPEKWLPTPISSTGSKGVSGGSWVQRAPGSAPAAAPAQAQQPAAPQGPAGGGSGQVGSSGGSSDDSKDMAHQVWNLLKRRLQVEAERAGKH